MLRGSSRKRLIFSALLILAGLGATAIALVADYIGISGEGFRSEQAALAFVGIFVTLSGIVLATPVGQRVTRGLLTEAEVAPRFRDHLATLLPVAVWFGIVIGLVEGIGVLVLRHFVDSVNISYQIQVWLPIIWIAPIFNAALFAVLALAIAAVSRLFIPNLSVRLVAAWLFSFGLFVNWIMIALRPWTIHEMALLLLAFGLSVAFTRWFLRHEAAAMRFWRRSLPWVAALVLVVFIGVQGGGWLQERRATAALPPAGPGSPDILVIVIDTLRADHLSSYGYERLTSPNIDRIASEGVLFESAFSTAPWTAPSHASMLTGTYPHEHGAQRIMNREPILDDRLPTISEALQERGYRTGAFSANLYFFTRVQGFGRGFIHFEDFFHSVGSIMVNTVFGNRVLREDTWWWKRWGPDVHPSRKTAPTINSSALRWMERDNDRPFFAFLNYFDVHGLYVPPEPYMSKFSFENEPDGIAIHSYLNDINANKRANLQNSIDHYDGAISYTDDYIGQLLTEIQRRELSDNLMVIITSDHGEAFGEHGVVQHANSLYLEEIHVPLILWQPGEIPAGVRIARPVTNASLPATILDLLGENGQSAFPNPSLAQLWETPQYQDDWPLPLSEVEHMAWWNEKAPSYYGAIKSLISPDWHYIENETQGTELYSWNEDPQEANDMAESAEGQLAINGFRRFLETVLARK